jgi:hypothetical protein
VLQVDAELTQFDDPDVRQGIVSGENGSVNGIPFALRSGLPLRMTR